MPFRHRSAAFTAAAALLTLAACSGGDGPAAAGPTSSGAVPTSATPPATASVAPAAVCVAQTHAGLDAEARAAQLLMVRTDNVDPSPDAQQVARTQVGGVFLAGRSEVRATSMRRSLATLQGAVTDAGGVPLLVAIDQEGGLVQTLRGDGFTRLPSARTQGGWSGEKLTDQVSRTARELTGVGVDLNLAPVADTVARADRDRNPPIGDLAREYGSDPAEVADAVGRVVAAEQAAGLLTTVKHFPGLGRVRVNTDLGRGAVDSTATADDPNLAPFRAGIANGTAAVMMSSASYPELDPDELAVFSRKIVTGLLREDLGFDGLVLSDDLGAAKAVQGRPPGERAVDFVAAGGDLALTNEAGDVASMTEALQERAARDPAFRARLDDAVTHVLTAKERAGLLTC